MRPESRLGTNLHNKHFLTVLDTHIVKFYINYMKYYSIIPMVNHWKEYLFAMNRGFMENNVSIPMKYFRHIIYV